MIGWTTLQTSKGCAFYIPGVENAAGQPLRFACGIPAACHYTNLLLDHSDRKAFTGSTFVARRAGT